VKTQQLAMFPLGMVVFPHQVTGLCIFESRYKKMLDDISSSNQFGTCLIERGPEVGGGDQRTSVGTIVQIMGKHCLSDGKTLIMVEGISCVEVATWLSDDPYPRAVAKERCCDDVSVDGTLLKSTESAVRALRTLQSEVMADQCVKTNCEMDADPWVRSWQLCSMTPMSVLDQFKVLSLSNPNDRLRLLAEICCERYGDYQRMLATDVTSPPFV